MILIPNLQLPLINHKMHNMRRLVDIPLGIHRVVSFEPVLGDLKPQIHFVFVFNGLVGLLDIDFFEYPCRLLIILPCT